MRKTIKKLPRLERSISELVELSVIASEDSNDPNTKVGAVLLNAHRGSRPGAVQHILSTGFNHIVSRGDPLSFERPLKYSRVIHAEVAAIGAAAAQGLATEGATLFITHEPCVDCAKAIVAAKIACVVIGTGQYFSNTPEVKAASEFMLHDVDVIYSEKLLSERVCFTA